MSPAAASVVVAASAGGVVVVSVATSVAGGAAVLSPEPPLHAAAAKPSARANHIKCRDLIRFPLPAFAESSIAAAETPGRG
jgi:hypothetical protein